MLLNPKYDEHEHSLALRQEADDELWRMFSLGWSLVANKKMTRRARAEAKKAAWTEYLEGLNRKTGCTGSIAPHHNPTLHKLDTVKLFKPA